MTLNGSVATEQALRAVGDILEAEGQSAAIVIIGGSALNLLGIVDRVTRDVDVLALGEPADANRPKLLEPGEELPSHLRRAAQLTARNLSLDLHWLNTGPALQWPSGFATGF